jgi:hypothetical protein
LQNNIRRPQPITYTWQAVDQSPVSHSGNWSDIVSFTWTVSGTKVITVTATNAEGTVTNTYTVTVQASLPTTPERQIYLPLIIKE